MRFVVLFISLVFPAITANEVSLGESPQTSNRRLLSCSTPTGFYLSATLQIQTYYPSYCTDTTISEIGAFLFNHFKTYSAYDATTGAIEVIPASLAPTLCTAVRRNLLEARNETDGSLLEPHDEMEDETGSDMHRKLGIPGFVFKLPVQCRACKPDNGDGRRRLANTSPVTIRVVTDAYPTEFSFTIRIPRWNGSPGTIVYASSGITSPYSTYTQTVYLEPNFRYFVVMRDLYGDGICCEWGEGSFQIVAGSNTNGETLLYDRGDFGLSRTLQFTTPPTPATPSSSLFDIGLLQIKYSEYLSYYLQQTYHTDQTKCLYGVFPSVAVSLKQVSYAEAMASC